MLNPRGGLVRLPVFAAFVVWLLALGAATAAVQHSTPGLGLAAAVGVGLVLGGAAGNLGDRFRRGAVADFIAVCPPPRPPFNLADVAVPVVGTILLAGSSCINAAVSRWAGRRHPISCPRPRRPQLHGRRFHVRRAGRRSALASSSGRRGLDPLRLWVTVVSARALVGSRLGFRALEHASDGASGRIRAGSRGARRAGRLYGPPPEPRRLRTAARRRPHSLLDVLGRCELHHVGGARCSRDSGV